MPFILEKIKAIKGKKLSLFFLQDYILEDKKAQRYTSKNRVFDENMKVLKIGDIIPTQYIYMAIFKGISRGLKPLLDFKDFAIFDKPSKLIVHPISKNTKYSLLDEIRFHFGEKANLVHRIDAETSGLVIVSKNKKSDLELKKMFMEKKYHKSYLAIVSGKLINKQTINKPLAKEGKNIGVRMKICNNGKQSTTKINPISYNKEKNISLVEAIPLTGRQHQIRVHLHSIGHTIIGDPIYGVDDFWAEKYLNKTISKNDRIKVSKSSNLSLHANFLDFRYKNIHYKLFSKNKEIYKNFLK